MATLLAQPKKLQGPPPTMRTVGVRKSELDAEVKNAMRALLAARDQWFTVAEGVTATSSIYEAFRRQGATVKIRPALAADGKTPKTTTVDGKTRKVFDVVAMLPAGEIRPVARKPWVKKEPKAS